MSRKYENPEYLTQEEAKKILDIGFPDGVVPRNVALLAAGQLPEKERVIKQDLSYEISKYLLKHVYPGVDAVEHDAPAVPNLMHTGDKESLKLAWAIVKGLGEMEKACADYSISFPDTAIQTLKKTGGEIIEKAQEAIQKRIDDVIKKLEPLRELGIVVVGPDMTNEEFLGIVRQQQVTLFPQTEQVKENKVRAFGKLENFLTKLVEGPGGYKSVEDFMKKKNISGYKNVGAGERMFTDSAVKKITNIFPGEQTKKEWDKICKNCDDSLRAEQELVRQLETYPSGLFLANRRLERIGFQSSSGYSAPIAEELGYGRARCTRIARIAERDGMSLLLTLMVFERFGADLNAVLNPEKMTNVDKFKAQQQVEGCGLQK